MTETIVTAPGRICLFGEHQDFLELAVIAAPIDLTITLECRPRADTRFVLDLPDLQEMDYFACDCEVEYRHKRDYIRSATNVLHRRGLRLTHGFDCTVRGTIPINAGTSSSSALVVAWTAFLLHTQEGDLPKDRESIASFAHEAEVLEFKEPGGMMDHYASALGGLLYIDCAPPITPTRLPARLEGFVLGDTGVPKDTTGTLRASRDDTREGLAILRQHLPGFDLRTTPLAEAEQYFSLMSPRVQGRVRANFINRDLCQEARRMLSSDEPVDQQRLGAMLLEHQRQLRDGISVSHPKLDLLIDAAMEAGALGGKLNGSGCGGCMFAYAPGRQEEVAEAINRAGGRAHIISISDGVKVEERQVSEER
ncbi:MAG: GHMP kinase [Armatimonadetes bacterium]|nr:GHMP kinase [Armatimonadota bacterium]